MFHRQQKLDHPRHKLPNHHHSRKYFQSMFIKKFIQYNIINYPINSFSPIVRRCIEEVKNTFFGEMEKMMESMQQANTTRKPIVKQKSSTPEITIDLDSSNENSFGTHRSVRCSLLTDYSPEGPNCTIVAKSPKSKKTTQRTTDRQ